MQLIFAVVVTKRQLHAFVETQHLCPGRRRQTYAYILAYIIVYVAWLTEQFYMYRWFIFLEMCC